MKMDREITPEDLEQLIRGTFRAAATEVGQRSAEAATAAGSAKKKMALADSKMEEADKRLKEVETEEKKLRDKTSKHLVDVNSLKAREAAVATAKSDLLERETAIARLLISKETKSKR